MKLISWNVNSLRAAEEKFLEFLESESPDVVLLQELRAKQEDLSMFLLSVPGYQNFFSPAKKPGYSGTAIYFRDRINFDELTNKVGISHLENEGRIVVGHFGDNVLVNLYTPNGNSGEERLAYKLEYYKQTLEFVKKLLENGKKIILGGDLNVAHEEIDLYDPAGNRNHSGFLITERKWFGDLLNLDFVDTFRMFEKSGGHYSWWNLRDPQRNNNQGWRFDYFLVSKNLVSKVTDAKILHHVFGSDHCPILLEIDL